MNINMKNIKRKNNGFALIEVIIALTVFLIAISVPLGVTTKALDESSLSRGKIIGTYFTHEGLESIREQRDNNLLSAGRSVSVRVNWLSDLSDCLVRDINASDKSGCDINSFGSIESCNPSSGCTAHIIQQNREINDVISFKRIIKIKEDVVAGRADVKVIVSWTENHVDRETSIQESLYKYLPF